MDRWLLSAEAVIPVSPPQEQNAPVGGRVASFSLLLSPPNDQTDIIKFIPKNRAAADDETRYRLEVIVEADQPLAAIARSLSLVDGTLDLITFLTLRPSSLVSRHQVVNLTQKDLADQGQKVEETIGVFGQMVRPDEPFPPHELLGAQGDERIKAALRWFRKATLSENLEDSFLAFYIVLELLSPVIKPEKASTHVCRECGKSTGIAKSAREGILFVVTDILNKDAKVLDGVAKTRAKIVHGANYGDRLRQIVAQDMGLMTELVVAAMKHVLHLRPESAPQPPAMQIDPNSGVLVVQYRRPDKSP